MSRLYEISVGTLLETSRPGRLINSEKNGSTKNRDNPPSEEGELLALRTDVHV